MSEEMQLERTRTLLWDEAHSRTLAIEKLRQKISEKHEELRKLGEQMQILHAQDSRLHAECTELEILFWRGARENESEWFKQIQSAGMIITYERAKDDVLGERIVLHAVDPREEQVKMVRKIFYGQNNDDNHGIPG
jgi:hypothetical protein